jgi:hypothetical protein
MYPPHYVAVWGTYNNFCDMNKLVMHHPDESGQLFLASRRAESKRAREKEGGEGRHLCESSE